MKVKVSKVGQPDVYVPAYEADGKTLNVDGVQADSTLQSSISTVSGDSVELVFYSTTSDWRIP